MTERKDPRRRLQAKDFYEIVDDLAGIGDADLRGPDPAALEQAEPVAASAGAAERFRQQWAAHRAAQTTGPAPRRRHWLLRPAAILPLSIGLLLLAAAPTYFFAWDGRDARNLAYEDALELVFDRNYGVEVRNNASGRILTSIQRCIIRIQRRASEDPRLQPDATAAFRAIGAYLAAPDSLVPEPGFPAWQMENLIRGLERVGPEYLDDHRAAMASLTESCRHGIRVLFRIQVQGETSFLRNEGKLKLAALRRILAQNARNL